MSNVLHDPLSLFRTRILGLFPSGVAGGVYDSIVARGTSTQDRGVEVGILFRDRVQGGLRD